MVHSLRWAVLLQTTRCLCLAVSVGRWRKLPDQRSLRWTCHKGQAGSKVIYCQGLNLAELGPWDAIVLRRMSTTKQSINQFFIVLSLYIVLHDKKQMTAYIYVSDDNSIDNLTRWKCFFVLFFHFYLFFLYYY